MTHTSPSPPSPQPLSPRGSEACSCTRARNPSLLPWWKKGAGGKREAGANNAPHPRVPLSPCPLIPVSPRPPAPLILALCLALLLAGCAQAPAAPAEVRGLRVEAPAQVVAGEPAAVVVLGEAADGAAATLTAIGSYGPRSYRSRFVGGAAPFVLPPADTAAAGSVALVAQAGAARAEARLVVLPAEVGLAAAPIIAPRSICAGSGASVVTIVVQDAYGNLPADETRAAIETRDPLGRGESVGLRMRGGIAWARYTAGDVAGRVGLRARVGAVTSDETPLTVLACDLAPIRLTATPPRLPADGRQTLTLATAPILDTANNPVADGTLVLFVADFPDGPRRIAAQTINGIAEAQVVASTAPGNGRVRAVVMGHESGEMAVSFIER